MKRQLFSLVGAIALIVSVSACGSSNGALQVATTAETGIVSLVHVTIQAEAAAYAAKAFSKAQHDTNLAALQKVNAGETALNASLLAWAANAGQPAPAAVTNAVKALAPILADLTPLLGVSTTSTLSTYLADLSSIIATLQAPAASKG